MKNFLRVTISSVEYGAGELTACAEANSFCGQSSAWFHLQEIDSFASAIEAYPLPSNDRPKLVGGYWKKGQQGEVEQEHLSIAIYPIGLLGKVGVHVRITSPFSDDRPESRYAAEMELQTTYQQLAGFAKELHRLAAEETSEASLHSGTERDDPN